MSVETLWVDACPVTVESGRIRIGHRLSGVPWDLSSYMGDRSGRRLTEELARRLTSTMPSDGIEMVAVSLPGTIAGRRRVQKSTRLGVHADLAMADELEALLGVPTVLLHDTECIAIGEAYFGALKGLGLVTPKHEEFALLYADEGVGATLFIDGKVHRGAGTAARIGRLVVEPNGSFSRNSSARGTLEVYAARPWVSTNIVAEYMAEKGKSGATPSGDPGFRRAVDAISGGDWARLSLQQIAAGLEASDPIADSVVESTARYLGLAVHSLITIVQPPAIVLGGDMMSDLPGFPERVISHARRLSYEIAWNQVKVRKATLGRRAQVLGAAFLASRRL